MFKVDLSVRLGLLDAVSLPLLTALNTVCRLTVGVCLLQKASFADFNSNKNITFSLNTTTKQTSRRISRISRNKNKNDLSKN